MAATPHVAKWDCVILPREAMGSAKLKPHFGRVLKRSQRRAAPYGLKILLGQRGVVGLFRGGTKDG